MIRTNVDHKAELSSDFEELFHKQDFSDVTFLVEGERIPCHRVILAIRSEYFRYDGGCYQHVHILELCCMVG